MVAQRLVELPLGNLRIITNKMGFLDRFFQPKTMSVTNTPEINEEEIRQQVREQERQQAAEWLARSGMREPRPEEVSTMDMNDQPELFPENNRVLATMFAETKGEPDEGVRAAFDTIRNRSSQRSRPWTSTIEQPSQYSGYGNRDYQNAMAQLEGTGELDPQSMEELMRMKAIMEAGGAPMDNRNMYLNPEMTIEQTGGLPSWAERLPLIDRIGKHNFYHDPNVM